MCLVHHASCIQYSHVSHHKQYQATGSLCSLSTIWVERQSKSWAFRCWPSCSLFLDLPIVPFSTLQFLYSLFFTPLLKSFSIGDLIQPLLLFVSIAYGCIHCYINDHLSVAGECFPTRYRCTAHGISAASGKLGSIIAQVGFGLLKDIGGKNNWIDHLLEVFALFMLTGICSSFLIPETKGKTLEELGDEESPVPKSFDGKDVE